MDTELQKSRESENEVIQKFIRVEREAAPMEGTQSHDYKWQKAFHSQSRKPWTSEPYMYAIYH